MSFNFEANYALPTNSTQFTKDFYDKIFFISGVERNETAARLSSINFFSRINFYEMIEEKIESFGLDGKACLMRLICEVSRGDFGGSSGVFGSIFHILFT